MRRSERAAADRVGDAADAHRARRPRGSGLYRVSIKPASSLAARLSTNDGFASGGMNDVAEPPSATHAGGGLSILVVEEDEINALLTRALLIKLGHHPTVVANGAAAIDCWLAARAGDAPYNSILMDLHITGMDGLEAPRRIRASQAESGAPRAPILALTAKASTEEREACLAAGMDGFLVTPLDRERLGVALANAGKAKLAA
jgi:CheY-like chemotaxis protein